MKAVLLSFYIIIMKEDKHQLIKMPIILIVLQMNIISANKLLYIPKMYIYITYTLCYLKK